jgi:hypothetical protein
MSRKKDLYWHKTAELCLAHNFKPAQVAKVIKDIFPLANVNGRHIGAYKRRLITEEVLLPEGHNRGMMTSNEMIEFCRSEVLDEDMFVYKYSVGSHKRSLKCFEYKLTTEEEDELEKVERWLHHMKKK